MPGAAAQPLEQEPNHIQLPNKPASQGNWVASSYVGCKQYVNMYVLQVPGGRERVAQQAVSRLLVPLELVQECFVPASEVMRRIRGEWVKSEELLFPGYVFITTNQIELVARRLGELPFHARVLGGQNERFVPLTVEEVAWLQALTNVESHVVELSQGMIEGDRVVVWSGPLKGHEGDIKKIDRHRRLAYLDMEMFGRTKTIRVGLEIVSKR